MRTYTTKGKLVTLQHFRYSVDCINLLVNMSYLVPNLTIPARDSKGNPCGVKVYDLRLERELLTLLNPAS